MSIRKSWNEPLREEKKASCRPSGDHLAPLSDLVEFVNCLNVFVGTSSSQTCDTIESAGAPTTETVTTALLPSGDRTGRPMKRLKSAFSIESVSLDSVSNAAPAAAPLAPIAPTPHLPP